MLGMIIDATIGTPIGSAIAQVFLLLGFALGCILTEAKYRRLMRIRTKLVRRGPKPA